MFSPIHHSFGPHVDASYIGKTFRIALTPRKYVHGTSIEELRRTLSKTFSAGAGLFASGREALLSYLKAIHLRPGEEVIVQGYTCVVVPNAIHAAGGVPIYADIDEETLNLTPESVASCITPRTRAVICQHTFGIPSDTKGLRTLCDIHHILLIEDCAHVIPDNTENSTIGILGDAVLLSFGRDKAISGITGGAIITRDPEVTLEIGLLESNAIELSWGRVLTLLTYVPRMSFIVRPLSWCGLQKPILALLNTLGLFSPILTEEEREGRMDPLLRKIPNACAALVLHSFSGLRRINDHRRMLTAYFLEYGRKARWPLLRGIHSDMPLQKFPLFVSGAREKRSLLKEQNIHLDDGWTGCIVCPKTVEITETGYQSGSDPAAEKACKAILSLPTHPTMSLRQAQLLAGKIDRVLRPK